MLAENLISDVIPSVKSSEIGQKALNWMDLFRVSHIPVVNGSKYLGLISDVLIYDLNLTDQPLEDILDKLDTSFAVKEQHIFEVAMVMYKLKLSVLPVLDSDKNYIGAITLYDLARRFAHLFSLHEIGGVIVLEMNVNDYSLVEISRIVENNGSKVLSSFIDRKPGTSNLEVILKLDNEELSSVIEAFTRFGYTVKDVFLDNSMINDLYDDRYDQFMKYMNI